MRVDVKPELLLWARERSGLGPGALAHRFPRIDAWETGEERPTLKQLESFAKATHTPVGYLFLQEPPVERVPIPDFRTVGNIRIGRPSPDLLDTVYLCQQRQEWYRDFTRSTGEEPLSFVGSASLTSGIEATAATMRHALGFDVEERRRMSTWTDSLRCFIGQADALGVLVMVSGVVGNNNRRHLDPEEFRGFALADALAPLVFINGADTKAAQMFTLAHELAHIWLGGPPSPMSGPPVRRRTTSRSGVTGWQPSSWCRPPSCGTSIGETPGCAMRSTVWRAGSKSARWSSCAGFTTPAGSRKSSSGKPIGSNWSGCGRSRAGAVETST